MENKANLSFFVVSLTRALGSQDELKGSRLGVALIHVHSPEGSRGRTRRRWCKDGEWKVCPIKLHRDMKASGHGCRPEDSCTRRTSLRRMVLNLIPRGRLWCAPVSSRPFSSYYGLKETNGAYGSEAGTERHTQRTPLDGQECPDDGLDGNRQHGDSTVAQFVLCLNGRGRAHFLLRRLPRRLRGACDSCQEHPTYHRDKAH